MVIHHHMSTLCEIKEVGFQCRVARIIQNSLSWALASRQTPSCSCIAAVIVLVLGCCNHILCWYPWRLNYDHNNYHHCILLIIVVFSNSTELELESPAAQLVCVNSWGSMLKTPRWNSCWIGWQTWALDGSCMATSWPTLSPKKVGFGWWGELSSCAD